MSVPMGGRASIPTPHGLRIAELVPDPGTAADGLGYAAGQAGRSHPRVGLRRTRRWSGPPEGWSRRRPRAGVARPRAGVGPPEGWMARPSGWTPPPEGWPQPPTEPDGQPHA